MNGGTVTVRLPDGETKTVRVIGSDSENDIAVLKIDDVSGLR